MITDELLDAVRKDWVLTNYDDIEENLHRDFQADIRDYWEDINIHELTHKCKEWAFKKGYDIFSGRFNISKSYMCYISQNLNDELYINQYEMFKSDTEPESVFAACQWIIENKDK